jgi:hypothetical protein
MLSAYIASVNAYHNRSKSRSEQQGSRRPSLDAWYTALHSAECAQGYFRDAEDMRKEGDIHSADLTVNDGLVELQAR